MRRVLAVCFAVAAGVPAGASGQERAEASLDANRVGLEDELTLTISVPEMRGGPPELPAMDAFRILGTQRVSRTSIVNTRVTQTTDFVYRLRPLRTGEAVVPPVAVPGYDPTRPLRVEVVSGSVRPAPTRPRSPFGLPADLFRDDFFGGPPDRRPPEIGAGDLFIRAEVEDAEVHVGEPVLVLYRLYARAPVLAAVPAGIAQPEGFWSEEVELPDVPWLEVGLDPREVRERRAGPGPRREQRTLGGITYDTYPILMRAVFPTGAGERELPGPRFEIVLPTGERSLFGPRRFAVVREAPPVTVRAAPLPEAGRPPGFAGAVGDYGLRAEILREDAPLGDRAAAAGEPLVLRVELEGVGNLRAAGTPRLPEGPELRRAFRIFEPDSTLTAGLEGAGSSWAFRGRRVWDFPIVPEAGGRRRIGAATLDVFNPRTGRYERLAAEPLEVEVEGAAGTLPAGEGPAAVERFGEDIRYLKPVGPDPGGRGGPRVGALVLWGLGLPVAWNLAVLLALRRRDHRIRNAAAFRRKHAARDARRRLARISGAGAEAALGEALAGYTAARLGIPVRGLTPAGAAAALARAGADPADARRFAALLSAAEGARFRAGGTSSGPAPDAAAASALIGRIEAQLGEGGGRR